MSSALEESFPNGDAAADVLVGVARCAVGGFASPPDLPPGSIDWERVLERAEQHGMVSLLKRALGLLPRDAVGREARELIAAENRKSAVRRMLAEAEVAMCLAALNERGVEPVVLKGLNLAERLYDDPVMRPFGDLDLLITSDQWPLVRDALADADARPLEGHSAELPPALDDGETYDHWLEFRTAGGLLVECTFDPLQIGVRCRSLDDFFDQAGPVTLLGRRVRRLAAEHELVQMCVHLNRHGFDRLVWWIDIALALQHAPGIDWEVVRSIAFSEKVQASVYFTLRHVKHVLGAQVPDEALRSLRPSAVKRLVWHHAWPDQAVRRFQGVHEGPLVFLRRASSIVTPGGLRDSAVNMLLCGRVPEKLRFFSRLVFPASRFLREKHPEEAGRGYARAWLRRIRRAPAPAVSPTLPAEAPKLSARVARGVAWNGSSRLATRALQFVVTAVLARLLTPTDFGLYGIVAMVNMLVALLMEFGFGTALIQKKDVSEADVCTAFWSSLALGTAMFALCAASAPLIAAAFKAPAVTPLLTVAALGLIVGAVAVAPLAVLSRRLDFRSIAIALTLSNVAYAVTALGLALAGFRVWSLVAAGLVMAFVRAVLLLVSSRIRIRFVVHLESLRSLVPFGTRILGSNLVTYVRANVDYLIVGSMLGAGPLGLYTLAFKLADFPRVRLAASITDVALPAMSLSQDEDEPMRRAYDRSLAAITLVAFPLLTGLAVLAPSFVRLVYGDAWGGAVAPLQTLLLMGTLHAVTEATTTSIIAKGHAGEVLRLSAWYLLAVSVFAFVGVRWGIEGVALGVSGGTLCYFLLVERSASRFLGIRLRRTARTLLVPVVSSVVLAASLVAFDASGAALGLPGAIRLITAVLLGIIVYAATALIITPAGKRAALWRYFERENALGQANA